MGVSWVSHSLLRDFVVALLRKLYKLVLIVLVWAEVILWWCDANGCWVLLTCASAQAFSSSALFRRQLVLTSSPLPVLQYP